ncbi:phage major capsid protein E [Rhizobium etli 8C-3]|uniref:Phage major capsid protein E n=1 Tax=Rhizobium etli 8C-3 TaxID=538025 RepID=A0A1L5P280_RHIET|nr:major capsid protein [Rhizobium etli]APO74264.1 phage major capsid protein E [Rhizobium etli 8C-3]
MADILLNTAELVTVLPPRDRPEAFLRDRYFGTTILSDSEEIVFDNILPDRELAPFVHPDVPGRDSANRGFKVTSFAPAYVKPQNTLRPRGNMIRLPGERIGGELTPAQRYAYNLATIIEDQDLRVTRREEFMCSQALRTGSVIVQGEDYPTQTINYGRDPALTIALTGADRWGEVGVDPMDDIEEWVQLLVDTDGFTAREVLLGGGAAGYLKKSLRFLEALDNRRQDGGVMQLGPVSTGAENKYFAVLGSIGEITFVQYSQPYTVAGVKNNFWPSMGVGVFDPFGFMGRMAYGAILDNQVLRAMERFPDMWMERNPSRTVIQTQAAPLPIAPNANASLFALVR